MTQKEIIEIMSEAEDKEIEWTYNDGSKGHGYATVYETDYDNDDEGHSLCVVNEPGGDSGTWFYNHEIKDIKIIGDY